ASYFRSGCQFRISVIGEAVPSSWTEAAFAFTSLNADQDHWPAAVGFHDIQPCGSVVPHKVLTLLGPALIRRNFGRGQVLSVASGLEAVYLRPTDPRESPTPIVREITRRFPS